MRKSLPASQNRKNAAALIFERLSLFFWMAPATAVSGLDSSNLSSHVKSWMAFAFSTGGSMRVLSTLDTHTKGEPV